jgi:[acyl-carrier-protein] S-malonyltransferase
VLAFLFPGQGAQHVGMGQALAERYPVARRVLEEAARAAELDLVRLAFEGPEERLAETEVTQPALLAVSVAAAAVLEEHGVRPDAVAGLSLGEYSALWSAGAARLEDLAPLVRRRGRYMQEAVPIGAGGMAAVLGLEAEGVERLCARVLESLAEEGVPAPPGGWVLAPANYNCPGQVVVSGHAEALRRAVELGRSLGARRVQPLAVSAPFHSALMRPAEERLAPEILALPLRDPAVPLVANVHAEVVRTAPEVRDALIRQVSRPVRWEAAVRRLGALGCDVFLEVGPGRVLSGFVARILPGVRVLGVADPEGVEAAVALVRGAGEGGPDGR